MRQRLRMLCLVALAIFVPYRVTGATLLVTNTGHDGPTCGPVNPCRSIGNAVANAAPSDRIVVGPGFYSSNLDGDNITNEPGEEPSGGIIVDKPLEIVSERGASSTMIRSTGPIFWVTTSNVTLGKLNNGFTIATIATPLLLGGASELVNVRVGGNVISIETNPDDGAVAIISANTRGRFENNRIVAPSGCYAGFYMAASKDVIARNVVMGCRQGFYLMAPQNPRVVRNVAIGNSSNGFLLDGPVAEFTGNLAVNNETGVSLTVPIPNFANNTFGGNLSHCGVRNFSGASINATNNYWGVATGPDIEAGGNTVCDGPAVIVPYLTADPTTAQAAVR